MDKNVRGFTPEAMQILERHSWRGNLRELRNTVRRIVLFANEDMIHADDLSMIQFEQSDPSDLALYPGMKRSGYKRLCIKWEEIKL